LLLPLPEIKSPIINTDLEPYFEKLFLLLIKEDVENRKIALEEYKAYFKKIAIDKTLIKQLHINTMHLQEKLDIQEYKPYIRVGGSTKATSLIFTRLQKHYNGFSIETT